MKFLCVTCDEPMKLTKADKPDEGGSITALFACPTCSYQVAMLTNPYETQMVQSLGVRIGPAKETAGEARTGEAQAGGTQAGGCPFSGMLAEMESKAQTDGVTWTAEALARLENIPDFVRPMAKQGIESFAKSNGHSTIDDAVMEEARGQFGM